MIHCIRSVVLPPLLASDLLTCQVHPGKTISFFHDCLYLLEVIFHACLNINMYIYTYMLGIPISQKKKQSLSIPKVSLFFGMFFWPFDYGSIQTPNYWLDLHSDYIHGPNVVNLFLTGNSNGNSGNCNGKAQGS